MYPLVWNGRINAMMLEGLIKYEYGREFNIAFHIMQDQRKVDLEVCPEEIDVNILNKFKEFGDDDYPGDRDDLFQSLVDDLCFRGKIEENNSYILERD